MDVKTLADIPPWQWPEQARGTLLEAIESREVPESDRLIAAEMAGEIVVMNDDVANALLTIVQSPAESAEMRAQAAISLGPILEYADTEGFEEESDLEPDMPILEETFEQIQSTLADVFADESVPDEVRRRVFEASVRAQQDWHQTAVRAAFGSRDPLWRQTAVFGMGYVPGFEREILQALDSDEPEVRRQAVIAAGNWEIDAAWPKIEDLLTAGTAKDLLIAAIQATAAIRPDDAPQLLEEFADSGDQEIVDAVEDALSMSGADVDEEEDAGDRHGW